MFSADTLPNNITIYPSVISIGEKAFQNYGDPNKTVTWYTTKTYDEVVDILGFADLEYGTLAQPLPSA